MILGRVLTNSQRWLTHPLRVDTPGIMLRAPRGPTAMGGAALSTALSSREQDDKVACFSWCLT